MIISIQLARYVDNYRLFLVFNTGECGEVDLQDIIFNYAAARSLRDIYYFKQFKLDEWATVTWDCGFDVSPETLYQRATGKQIDWLIPSNKIETEQELKQ